MSEVFLNGKLTSSYELIDLSDKLMQYMKCLKHKLFSREEVQHTNINYLSWVKNRLTRLMRTSNVAIVKNCFAQKEDCDIIVELRTAKENLKT